MIKHSFIVLLFTFCIHQCVSGQDTLTVFSPNKCVCTKTGKAVTPEGTLGLYANTPDYRSNGYKSVFQGYKDTLLMQLRLDAPVQQVVIPKNTKELTYYRVVFTPIDTLRSPRTANVIIKEAKMDCFFFNLRYTSFIQLLKNNDSLLIHSVYAGKTAGDYRDREAVPAHSMLILKKRFRYFIAYADHTTPKDYVPVNIVTPWLMRHPLNRSQVKALQRAEHDFFDALPPDSIIPVRNSVYINQKEITTFGFWNYFSKVIWDAIPEKENLFPKRKKQK